MASGATFRCCATPALQRHPKTCISTITLEKFGLEASTANHISIKLGERSVYAAIPDENCAAYVRGLNILGSDVLQLLVPDLVPLLIKLI